MRKELSWAVYLVLILAWLGIAIWQYCEHHNAVNQLRTAARTRATDVSMSLSALLRSQARFGAIHRQALQDALRDLAKISDLQSIALQNPSGRIVAQGGTALTEEEKSLAPGEEIWMPSSITHVELVDLATINEDNKPEPVIIIDTRPSDMKRSLRHKRAANANQPDNPPGEHPVKENLSEEEKQRKKKQWLFLVRWMSRRLDDQRAKRWLTQLGKDRLPDGMSREEFDTAFQAYIAERGIHRFVVKLDTTTMQSEIRRNSLLRVTLTLLALLACIGIALGLRGLQRSSSLHLRLIRAQEMNNHLREMNLTAAGLAHETRNPLNVIRGLVQMISQSPDDPALARRQAEAAIGEVDRVTESLNEFIDYSRPREPKLGPVPIHDLIRDVQRVLNTDLQDKEITLENVGKEFVVEADQGLLRQLLFNLIINAVKAVPKNAQIKADVETASDGTITLTIADSGPGVPEESRQEIFRPYISLHEAGTGLGLAVVRQIALAHHWDIEYVESRWGGAAFRISGIKPAGATSTDG